MTPRTPAKKPAVKRKPRDMDKAFDREIAGKVKPREYAIEDTIVAEAEAAGWFVRKLSYPGRRRAPDRWFLRGGRNVFIEFKRSGKDITPAQAEEGAKIKAHGGEWYFVASTVRARAILGL